MRRPALPALLALATLAACAPSTLPGTTIPDTPETRAVLEVLSRYKSAFEALDAGGIIALAAPTYLDREGLRGAPPRDLAALKAKLPDELKRLKGVKMDVTVKDARIKGDNAEIDYFVVLHYSLALASGERWKSESDDTRLALVRVGGAWKIQSGL